MTGDAVVDGKLRTFADYFARQWLADVPLWNHYDNDGARTTNYCEGYNRGLADTFEHHQRPKFNVFLVKLQSAHNGKQVLFLLANLAAFVYGALY